jgi:hypothetical protein
VGKGARGAKKYSQKKGLAEFLNTPNAPQRALDFVLKANGIFSKPLRL